MFEKLYDWFKALSIIEKEAELIRLMGLLGDAHPVFERIFKACSTHQYISADMDTIYQTILTYIQKIQSAQHAQMIDVHQQDIDKIIATIRAKEQIDADKENADRWLDNALSI